MLHSGLHDYCVTHKHQRSALGLAAKVDCVIFGHRKVVTIDFRGLFWALRCLNKTDWS